MLSQTTEYALRAMMHLSGLEPTEAANSESISRHTKVPQGYLSKILRDLVVAELVISQRGPNGGFSLARPASSITMLDVVNAVDPIHRIKKCPLGNPEHLALCPLHKRIDDAAAMLEREFTKTSLSEVLASNVESVTQCRVVATAPVRKSRRSS